jgi:hypothetical protein
MRIIVTVVVYNRLENLKRWIKIWNECKPDAEFIIIHTGPDNWQSVCEGATYIHRKNQGFDIGCFQDVCRGRLSGFPKEWDYLIWVTDDTFPMTKDFISPFIKAFENPNVGISCMKISTSVNHHVRTTGFCLRAETAAKLDFPADPVLTKQQCYLFEHRGNHTLTNQIRNMGLDCVQVAPDAVSPLWDQGYWRRLDRLAEHYQIFPTDRPQTDKVTFICTIYNTYPQIISSLILQTHQDWELILIHDGPNESGLKRHIPNDPRIKYIETKERKGNWGHSLRAWALEEINKGNLSDPDYIVITNADNYHVPVYTEYMLKGFKKSHTAVASYCDKMTHSYKAWDVIPVKLEKGYVDCAGVMVKKEVACEVGWRDTESHSSDWTFFSDIASRYSWKNFISVKGALLVHN